VNIDDLKTKYEEMGKEIEKLEKKATEDKPWYKDQPVLAYSCGSTYASFLSSKKTTFPKGVSSRTSRTGTRAIPDRIIPDYDAPNIINWIPISDIASYMYMSTGGRIMYIDDSCTDAPRANKHSTDTHFCILKRPTKV